MTPPAYTSIARHTKVRCRRVVCQVCAEPRLSFIFAAIGPCQAGRWSLRQSKPLRPSPRRQLAFPCRLWPASTNAPEVAGGFIIDRPGKISATIVDVDGQL